ncbi:MAG TPA: cytochrome c biogenesis protein CcsA [Candidatus Binataceae bacterium]|nr:cytochrome c biogenesis protein CcsA [Candidatus Binataceae bacterium]
MKSAWRLAVAGMTLATMIAAIWMSLINAPTEAEQGTVQRIFYFHVPCAMVTFCAFGLVAIAGALYLWLGNQIWDDLEYAAAEIGMVFCTLVLVTGSIWAKPIWGTWWTWDSRLTTTFILWLIYAGYLMLRAFGGDTPQVARFAAVVGIFGALDVPLIIVSVRLWRTIHPAVLLTRQNEHGLQDPRMVAALLMSMAAFTLLFVWLLGLRFKTLRLNTRLNSLKREVALWRAAEEGGRA